MTSPAERGREPRYVRLEDHISPALARKNLVLALALFGVFLLLFVGTVVVAFIYLAVAD